MELTKQITLSSGGRAWAYRELTWADDIRRWHFIENAEPKATIERGRQKRQRERDIAQGIAPGPDPEIILTKDEIREAAEFARYCREQELEISIERWENVRDPRTGEQLIFPDGLPHLGVRDGDELLAGCRAALRERAPDPNAGGDRSSSESSTTPDSIPNGPKS